MDLGLQGKVVIVTGGARGIGAATVRGFIAEGANVVIADILQDAAQDIAQTVAKKATVRAVAIKTDVSKKAEVDKLVAAVIKEFGRIDILVNNAGVVQEILFTDIEEADWDRIQNTNIKGIYLMVRAVAPHMMKAKQGRIVNIASRSGKEGQFGLSHYAASKFAVVGLTQSLAKELAPHGINVNAVCPGILRTAMWESILDSRSARSGLPREEVFKQVMETIPLKRPQTPEDIANAVLFLSSDVVAKNVTGESFSVNGGIRMD